MSHARPMSHAPVFANVARGETSSDGESVLRAILLLRLRIDDVGARGGRLAGGRVNLAPRPLPGRRGTSRRGGHRLEDVSQSTVRELRDLGRNLVRRLARLPRCSRRGGSASRRLAVSRSMPARRRHSSACHTNRWRTTCRRRAAETPGWASVLLTRPGRRGGNKTVIGAALSTRSEV